MKTRPVVIQVPVLNLPSWRRVWSVAWCLCLLVGIIFIGRVVSLLWPSQEWFIAFITGTVFAYAFADMGWRGRL